MDKLVVKGKATGSYPVDTMKFHVSFTAEADCTRDAIEWAQEQCEDFLEKLQLVGIGTKNVVLLDDCVSRCVQNKVSTQALQDKDTLQTSQCDRRDKVYAKRSIDIILSADPTTYACILNLIRHHNYSCDYNVEYYITDTLQYQEELISKAISIARMQAEIVTKAAGQKLLQIENISTSSKGYIPCNHIVNSQGNGMEYDSQMPLSENLTLCKKELTEEVEVTWTIGV